MHLPISDKIELNILHQNSHQAEKNKIKFNNYNLLCLNIMSSPGAGKTRLLEITLEDLSKEFQSAVLEGDMTTNLDAARLEKLNIPVVPITTGRACHLDANMVSGGLKLLEKKINPDLLDILLVENVGNLVCPAEFEIGEHFKVALLSITEGEDKPLKYPIMFREADLILITKVDLLPHLNFDINELKNFIKNYLKNKFPNSKVYIDFFDSEKTFYLKDITEINNIYSTPIVSLLTLSNSESHNFTAESLFKNASNTWNDNDYTKLKKWLENKGLPVTNTYFADASGLSRKNKITTKLIVLFLDKMRYSNDFQAYQSSLAIMGVRGTLAKRFVNSELSGKFFGKTGTLSNVFALSGFLYKNEKPIIVSIIQNSNNIDKEKAFILLRDVYHLKSC